MPNIQWFDFIGDIHGQADLLRGLLGQLDYRERNGTFHHPRSHAVFLGDLLNRGPKIRQTGNIVRRMVERGAATMLLGNHELLALWQQHHGHRSDAACPFSAKARRQLQATRREFARSRGEWLDLLNWLLARPLFFRHRMVRGVHACWEPRAIATLWGNRIRATDFDYAGSRRFLALWTILEGPALYAPNGERLRIRWWERNPETWRNAAYPAKPGIPPAPIPVRRLRKAAGYAPTAPLLFFGHYGFPKPLRPLRPNLACLDLAVAQGGPVAAYRWTGESRIHSDRFFSCSPRA